MFFARNGARWSVGELHRNLGSEVDAALDGQPAAHLLLVLELEAVERVGEPELVFLGGLHLLLGLCKI